MQVPSLFAPISDDSESTRRASVSFSSVSDNVTPPDASANGDSSLNKSKSGHSIVISPPSLRHRRRTEHLEDLFTVNKLRFSSLGLYGRGEELSTLTDSLERLMGVNASHNRERQRHHDNLRKELVFLSGQPGTGKSALALALKAEVDRLPRGLFVSGKFDLYLRDEPFAGIASACAEICQEIASLEKQQQTTQASSDTTVASKPFFEVIQQKFMHELGDELPLLFRIIPALEEITREGRPEEHKVNQHTEFLVQGISSIEIKNRFQFAFRRFLRVIGSFYAPLVLFLDDLQWADRSSLELLEYITGDAECRTLMIIGAYRSTEVDETHSLSQTIRHLEDKDRKSFNLTQINIGDLNVAAIVEFLKDLLSTDDDKTIRLAEICLRKTNGNAFFLIQFLTMLQEHRLLEYNMGIMKWRWDQLEIEKTTGATVNVVDLLKSRMASLSTETTLIMRLGASLGSTFQKETVLLLLDGLPNSQNDDAAVMDNTEIVTNTLELLCTDGFIEPISSKGHGQSFKWVHDQIQEAATTLVSHQERIAFNRMVGRLLVDRLNDKDLDAAIFTVVNLLNEGASSEKQHIEEYHPIQLAELNLRAAQKAIDVSAFESAAKYASIGIECLPPSRWKDHYKLCLDLFSEGAEAEAFLGRIDRMENYCNEILNQPNRPLPDKLRAWKVLLESIANRGELHTSLEQCRDVLEECGCSLPRRRSHVAIKTILAVRKIKATAKVIHGRDMPLMESDFRKELMAFLYRMSEYTYLTENPLLPVVNCRLLTWTLKYGVCDLSIPSFGALGMAVTGVMNDLQGGTNYAKQGLAMLEKLNARQVEAKTLFLTYGLVLCWTSSIQSTLKPLLRGYTVGLQIGDIRNAMWSVYHYIILELQAGIPLTAVEPDCQVYGAQMLELQMDHGWVFLIYAWRTCLILMDRRQEAVEMEVSYKMLTELLKDKFMLALLEMHQMVIYCYTGDFDSAAELALKKGEAVSKTLPSSPMVMWDAFLRALSLFAKARKTKRRKYKKEALRVLAKIRNWVEQGCPNVRHYEAFLEAECAALDGKKYVATKHYEYAVTMSARSGFIQDHALAQWRLGEFLLEEMSDEEEAKYRFQEAIKRYQEWGAVSAANAVLSRYPELLPHPKTIVAVNT